MNRAFILLGSNIDKENNLVSAVHMLRELCRVAAISPVYETAPVGLREQPNFLNVAVLVYTDLPPTELRATVLAEIERRLQRVRTADKNAPRTIDADLILYIEETPGVAGRYSPDPELLRYPHIAVPIAALAPNLRHPETGERLQDIADRLLREAGAENESVRPQQALPQWALRLWARPDIDRRLENGTH
jgi:2-amino-4-hydroxy-6-hydroxymethyldihydropteridine diphosphokinase